MLVAPAGFGKTTLLVHYAGGAENVLSSSPGMTVNQLLHSLAQKCGIVQAPRNPEELLASMCDTVPVTLFIDDAHVLASDVLDVLYRVFGDAPEHIKFVVASRNKKILREPRWIMEGVIEALWTANLAFDEREVQDLASAYGIDSTDDGLAALLHATEGWPVVVSAILRFAATNETTLEQGLVDWFGHYGEALRETILSAAENEEERKLLEETIKSGDVDSQTLRALEECGLFVHSRSGTPTMLRAAERAFLRYTVDATPEPGLKVVQAAVLGTFTASIGGVTIDWLRRRDAQVFKYLLLQRGHRATREDLMRAFWPSYDPAQAGQSLRTTLSNIRNAIRTSLKLRDDVPYLSTEENVVALRAAAFQTDLDDFLHNVLRARESFASGQIDSAARYGVAARGIYAGPFIVDANDPFYNAIARSVQSSFVELQTILLKIDVPIEATG